MDQNIRMIGRSSGGLRIFSGLVVSLLLLTIFVNVVVSGEDRMRFEGVTFRVVKQDPAQVKLVWRDAADRPMRTFDRVQSELSKSGQQVSFLMNGGIFEPGGIPSGLHIEDGKLVRPVNLKDGNGNFFLKPSGVLVWGAPLGKPQLVEAGAFAKQSALPAYGLQSGPLLVLGGKLHPAFRKASPNLKHRNGVGVNAEGQLVFAMTDKGQETNFHKFARLFRDRLGCPDALFLDGDISQMAVNPKAPVESNRFGAIFVRVEKAGE